ncbi:hypothetical protein GCM10007173_36990 [Glutamicibacter ardleyensis]|uniref:Uncharacterized protein n=1 Tax=Glutamicibacter ardleyensis TaxID=225894 RepID=A0ABQ2DVV1_9MICC|nr:hypothetical protein GCM10007173_36990 [Glutamicibacter ardleyensis]
MIGSMAATKMNANIEVQFFANSPVNLSRSVFTDVELDWYSMVQTNVAAANTIPATAERPT